MHRIEPLAIFSSGTVTGNGHKRHKKHKWCPLCLLCFLWLNNFFSKSHPILKMAEPQVCRQDDPPRCEFCKNLMDEQDGQDLISAVVRPVLLVIRTPATDQRSAVLRTRRVRELSRECGGSKCRSANAKRNSTQWRFSLARTPLDPTSLTAAKAAPTLSRGRQPIGNKAFPQRSGSRCTVYLWVTGMQKVSASSQAK